MKYFFVIILIFSEVVILNGQIIDGYVTDVENQPIKGVNVFVKGSYDGATTDNKGYFVFKTSLHDTVYIVATHIGYENSQTLILLNKNTSINITLKEKSTEVKEVVITAGTFIAGDKKRGIQMTTLDILTTPNSNGDIAMALGTLPGVQKVGEEGAIFVRGGEKYETKTYVDGMLVTNPYSSKVPDLPMRGRFSPSLFNGVSFSSGGYSAEYGQALSSALILQSFNFPSKTFTSISLLPFGPGISHTQKYKTSSLTINLDYINLKPYHSLIPQKVSWIHSPEELQTNIIHRKKLNNGGLIKSFVSFNNNRLALNLPNYLAYENNTRFNLTNSNIYANSVLTSAIFGQWMLKTGFSVNYDDELIDFEHIAVKTYNRAFQYKLSFQRNLAPALNFKTGGEYNFSTYTQYYERNDSAINEKIKFTSPLLAYFAEVEWKITDKISARLGTRTEFSKINQRLSLVPRIAFAYKTGLYSQFSFAYGIFTQLPQDNYLKFKPNLRNEKAIHYILNYEYSKTNRLVRLELFSKEYAQLTCYKTLNNPDPSGYNNNGYGYARGFEFFFRDQKSIQRGDYWITYTLLDTKKLYKDGKQLERPNLFSKHSLNIVGKYFISPIHSQIGLTYQFASGRPYYQPENNTYKQCFTGAYHNLSTNLSYLTNLMGYFTIVHISISNILGFDNTFGYHFVKAPDGVNYTSIPIKPASKRFYVIGIFITLDKNYITN